MVFSWKNFEGHQSLSIFIIAYNFVKFQTGKVIFGASQKQSRISCLNVVFILTSFFGASKKLTFLRLRGWNKICEIKSLKPIWPLIADKLHDLHSRFFTNNNLIFKCTHMTSCIGKVSNKFVRIIVTQS